MVLCWHSCGCWLAAPVIQQDAKALWAMKQVGITIQLQGTPKHHVVLHHNTPQLAWQQVATAAGSNYVTDQESVAARLSRGRLLLVEAYAYFARFINVRASSADVGRAAVF
jgi:hypothetical protein